MSSLEKRLLLLLLIEDRLQSSSIYGWPQAELEQHVDQSAASAVATGGTLIKEPLRQDFVSDYFFSAVSIPLGSHASIPLCADSAVSIEVPILMLRFSSVNSLVCHATSRSSPCVPPPF